MFSSSVMTFSSWAVAGINQFLGCESGKKGFAQVAPVQISPDWSVFKGITQELILLAIYY